MTVWELFVSSYFLIVLCRPWESQELNITRKVNKESRVGLDGAKPGETERGEGRREREVAGDT